MGNATLQPACPRPKVRHQRLESVHRQRRHRATLGRPRRAAGGKPGAMPMRPHVCPWWGGYFIDNRLRRLFHKPEKILGPYVRSGMTVMDVGCGMGLFAIAMARLVGPARAGDRRRPPAEDARRAAETGREGRRRRSDRHAPVRGEFDRGCRPVDFALAFYSATKSPTSAGCWARYTNVFAPAAGSSWSSRSATCRRRIFKTCSRWRKRFPRPGRSARIRLSRRGGFREGAIAPN